jgi:hypothetical protein
MANLNRSNDNQSALDGRLPPLDSQPSYYYVDTTGREVDIRLIHPSFYDAIRLDTGIAIRLHRTQILTRKP